MAQIRGVGDDSGSALYCFGCVIGGEVARLALLVSLVDEVMSVFEAPSTFAAKTSDRWMRQSKDKTTDT